MKLTILVDNNVLQSKNFFGEHGLSFYIEDEGKKILFDMGYSDAFLKNAQKMGIDLLDLDYIVLSHGHYDHTWGMSYYLPFYVSAIKQGRAVKKLTIVTHPDTFNAKFHDETGSIGCMVSREILEKSFDIKLTKGPFKITKNVTFLGEIPRGNDFEAKEPLAKTIKNNKVEDDYICEDSALVYKNDEGLVLITGCSHSGICNIIEHAKLICNSSKFVDVIGGFHLVKSSEERLLKTAEYLLKLDIKNFHPCHCTDFDAKIFLSKNLNLDATGVGLKLDY